VRSVSVCLTVAIHSVVAVFLMASCQQGSPVPSPSLTAGAPTKDTVYLTSTSEAGAVTCESSYRGIGLSSQQGQVYQVADNGPAYQAGIRVGDILDGVDQMWPDLYPVGTVIRVKKLVSADKWITLLVRVDVICRV
jgi:S1-C subfamily serine protease